MTDYTENAGQSIKPSEWFVIDQNRINAFADATLDHQYIHTDPERAKASHLGGTIAHGFLLLSLMPKLVSESMMTPPAMVMGINYGFDKVRFLSSVRPGDAIRLTATIKSIEAKDNNSYLQRLDVTLEIQGQSKPAIVCEWLNLFVCE